ncbi:MAG: flavoprotein [Frankia sp.]|nr:flavoprotein [Frankia sp.]
MTGGVVGLVVSAAGGAELVRPRLVEPLLQAGRSVAVTATPTALTWLEAADEVRRIEEVTGWPVRSAPRLPGSASPHPRVDCYAVVPATANMVAKIALGIADNQALAQVCEAVGGRSVPVVLFPRVNVAHAGQPAWPTHIETLRRAGVRLVYGEDVWPLHAPRSAGNRELPWSAILDAINAEISAGPARRQAL